MGTHLRLKNENEASTPPEAARAGLKKKCGVCKEGKQWPRAEEKGIRRRNADQDEAVLPAVEVRAAEREEGEAEVG
jgi:hypothetical protein